MKHVLTLFAKVVTIGILMGVILGVIGGVDYLGIYAAYASITALSYLLGDLLVLPRYGNGPATVFDGLLTAATVWVLQFFVTGMTVTPFVILLAGVSVAIAEFFFHRFMTLTVLATSPGDLEDDG